MERMRSAAAEWLRLLDDDARAAATYGFDDLERFRWHYTPGTRGGLFLAGMSAAQRGAALLLLESGLSSRGHSRARAVMELESSLREIERSAGRPGWERRDPAHYWFAVFGDPAGAVWAWRMGGHHVCVHTTVVDEEVRVLPLFLGANPATAPDGTRVLAAEEDVAWALLESLTGEQRAVAVVSDEPPSDIITGNAVRAEVTAVPRGIRYADLTDPQRERLAELVGVFTDRPAADLPVDLEHATFAWLGSPRVGEGHYYAVHAGTLLLELDNTQNHANHVHTVVRDIRRDWGEDLLEAHYHAAHLGG
ncbi:MAG: DUF3500 domain-containing protein [Marmoricola sp.]